MSNVKSDLKDITQEITGWENNKIIRTIKYLTINPGKVVSGYCSDEKHKYLSPIIYFFSVTAIEVYIASASGMLDFIMQKYAGEMRTRLTENPAFAKANVDVENIVSNYSTTMSFVFSEVGQKLIIIPILLPLTWFFFRKYNSSFKDNSWFALFTLGHVTLLTLPLTLYWYLTKDFTTLTVISYGVALVYWVWASVQFYNISLMQAIVPRVLMMIVAMVVLTILGGLMGIIIVASSLA